MGSRHQTVDVSAGTAPLAVAGKDGLVELVGLRGMVLSKTVLWSDGALLSAGP
jgi:hypothetical protein